jgi:hypothetical protein
LDFSGCATITRTAWLSTESVYEPFEAHDLGAIHDRKRIQLCNDLVVGGVWIVEFKRGGVHSRASHHPIFGKPIKYHLGDNIREEVLFRSTVSTGLKGVGVELMPVRSRPG